jgi:hypothetical protein
MSKAFCRKTYSSSNYSHRHHNYRPSNGAPPGHLRAQILTLHADVFNFKAPLLCLILVKFFVRQFSHPYEFDSFCILVFSTEHLTFFNMFCRLYDYNGSSFSCISIVCISDLLKGEFSRKSLRLSL